MQIANRGGNKANRQSETTKEVFFFKQLTYGTYTFNQTTQRN
jgi:hypothetical protein